VKDAGIATIVLLAHLTVPSVVERRQEPEYEGINAETREEFHMVGKYFLIPHNTGSYYGQP